jgi:hypothetical protein
MDLDLNIDVACMKLKLRQVVDWDQPTGKKAPHSLSSSGGRVAIPK